MWDLVGSCALDFLPNQFFNQVESHFSQNGAILPLFTLGFELVDPIFGGLKLTTYLLQSGGGDIAGLIHERASQCKFEYRLGNIVRV